MVPIIQIVTVTIDVLPPPTASDDSDSVNENDTLVVAAPGVLSMMI